jgi:Trypsin-like serine proteases, typically periplasmic, contain C-terminal PDZ domain
MRKLVLFILLFINIDSYCQNFVDIVKEEEKSVVLIKTYDKDGDPLLQGTGFFIDSVGKIVSNYHVFSGAYSAIIYTTDNKEYGLKELLKSSKDYDIIVFSINAPKNKIFNYVKFESKKPEKGEDIFVIGNPLGLENSVSKGIISGIHTIKELGSIYQITAPISPGSSGSPVFNFKGYVIGVASFQLINGQNLNFAIDINCVKKIITNDALLLPINVIKHLPKSKQESINIIDSLMDKQDTLSLYFVNEYIKQYPKSFEGYLNRAKIYSSSFTFNLCNLFDKTCEEKYIRLASSDFTQSIQIAPNNPKTYFERANAKYNYCRFKEKSSLEGWNLKSALEDLLKCEKIDGEYNKVNRLNLSANIKNELKDYKGELEAYDKIIRIEPNQSNTYTNRALVKYYHFNDTIGAIKDLDLAIKLEPLCNYFSWRASIKFATGDYSGTLTDLNKIINDCSNSIYDGSDTYYLKSSVLYKIDGDINDALAAINIAISKRNSNSFFPLNADDSKLFYQRALVYKQLNKYQSALIDVNKVFELTGKDLTKYDYYLRSSIKKGMNDYIGALKDINKALELDVNDDYNNYFKGIIQNNLNDYIGAIISFTKAIELNPREPEYLIKRGLAKFLNNENGCSDWSKAGDLGDYEAYQYIKDYCK